jgi:hypothetical protein
VHEFETLTITDGASVDFGGDRVVVRDAAGSSIGSDAEIRGKSTLRVPSIDVESGQSVRLQAQDIEVAGNVNVDGGELSLGSARSISVDGDVVVTGGGRVIAPRADASSKSVYELDLEISGALLIDSSSAIDVSGDGYPPPRWSGPDFTQGTRPGCHGGLRGDSSGDCIYGRYVEARFAGSASDDDAGNPGGGVVRITAGSVQVDGAIWANGATGDDDGGGAGGAVHIDTPVLSGAGEIVANGGDDSSGQAGAGGRISIRTPDRSGFTGRYAAASGAGNSVSGAGTVYLKAPSAEFGHLRVANEERNAPTDSTVLRSVGRHEIVAAEQVSDDEWRIEVDGTPWKTHNPDLARGIVGLDVDLSANETSSPRYEVSSNGEGILTLRTPQDLSGVVGNELVGVHVLQTLRVGPGASLSAGQDRIVVQNLDDSRVEGTVTSGDGSALP